MNSGILRSSHARASKLLKWFAIPVGVLILIGLVLMGSSIMTIELELDNQQTVNQYFAVVAAGISVLAIMYCLLLALFLIRGLLGQSLKD